MNIKKKKYKTLCLEQWFKNKSNTGYDMYTIVKYVHLHSNYKIKNNLLHLACL